MMRLLVLENFLPLYASLCWLMGGLADAIPKLLLTVNWAQTNFWNRIVFLPKTL